MIMPASPCRACTFVLPAGLRAFILISISDESRAS
jgi:hypothetical protein